MESSRKNRALYIDKEALSALTFVQEGFLYPVTGLMNRTQMLQNLETKKIKDKTFPFPFILAPSGVRNKEILTTIEKDEILNLICDGIHIGEIKNDEVFKINPKDRLRQIYGTFDPTHPGVAQTLSRIGDYAICGEYTLYNATLPNRNLIKEAKERVDAKRISAIMMAANPLHRGHERLIRQTLDKTVLVVIFLLK
jgi:sulfate adenylyltransferase